MLFRSYSVPDNTQEFPDFIIHNEDFDELLEVKCFTDSPNFDVANFSAYCRSLVTKAKRLNSKYLIFEYEQNISHAEQLRAKNWRHSCIRPKLKQKAPASAA